MSYPSYSQICNIDDIKYVNQEQQMSDFIFAEYDTLCNNLSNYIPTLESTNKIVMDEILERDAKNKTRIPLFSLFINIQGTYNHISDEYEILKDAKYKRIFEHVFNGYNNGERIINRLKSICVYPYHITVVKNRKYIRSLDIECECYTIYLNFKDSITKNDVSTKTVSIKKTRSCWFFDYQKILFI